MWVSTPSIDCRDGLIKILYSLARIIIKYLLKVWSNSGGLNSIGSEEDRSGLTTGMLYGILAEEGKKWCTSVAESEWIP